MTDANQSTVNQYLSYKYGIALDGESFGVDTLTGGTGSDTFEWSDNSLSNTSNTDIITDFNQSAGSYVGF